MDLLIHYSERGSENIGTDSYDEDKQQTEKEYILYIKPLGLYVQSTEQVACVWTII
jgi:hypothetical protein